MNNYHEFIKKGMQILGDGKPVAQRNNEKAARRKKRRMAKVSKKANRK